MLIKKPGDLIDHSIKKSIFLAGPTPRNEFGVDWRIEAAKILGGWNGIVFIPSPFLNQYTDPKLNKYFQIKWETQALELATKIVFWIPREMEHMPGFTTNVEFGLWVKSGKVIYGHPENAPKTEYLDWHASENLIPIHYNLSDMLYNTVKQF